MRQGIKRNKNGNRIGNRIGNNDNDNDNNGNVDSRSSSIDATATATTRSLIVGGTDAVHYPRSIVFLSDRMDDLSCGGSLISPTIVLAAGHCEISLVTHAVFRRYDHPTERSSTTGLGVNADRELRVPVQTEILHPGYDRATLEHDVMLIVLEHSPNDAAATASTTSTTTTNSADPEDPIDDIPYMKLHSPDDATLDEIVKILQRQSKEKTTDENDTGADTDALSSSSSSLTDTDVWPSFLKSNSKHTPDTTILQFKALGWGHTTDGDLGKPSEVLQEVMVNYVANKECETAKENNLVSYQGRITDDMMCTFASDRDTCHGDSGGPIVLVNPNYSSSIDKNNDNDEYPFLQVGIVSWGEDCADHIFPGVASRVAASYNWIRDRVCSIDGAGAPAHFGCALLGGDEHTYSPAPSESPTTEEDGLNARLNLEVLSLIDNDNDSDNNNNSDEAASRSYAAPETQVKVAVEIFLDVFAAETSWSLTESDTAIVVESVPFDTYQYENDIRDEIELTRGKSYTFEIKDQYGDGITNRGSYRIYVIDETKKDRIGELLVNRSGDFDHRRSHTFQVSFGVDDDSPTKEEAKSKIIAGKLGQQVGRSEDQRLFEQRFGLLSGIP